MKRLIWALTVLVLFLCFQNKLLAANSGTDFNAKQKVNLYADKNFISSKYVLGPNDVLSIYVYDSPEFTQERIRIQPDGKVVIEPLGALQVSGMTVDELHELLVSKYKYYLNDPRVSVKLDQTKPFIVYVTGAVLSPGSYEIDTDTSNNNNNNSNGTNPEIQVLRRAPLLSNVLVAAGGISYDADLEHIKIINRAENKEININLLDLLDKGDSSQDIYLISGDTVSIPRLTTPLALSDEKYKKYASASFSPKSVPIKVFGYVNSPGLVKLDPTQSLNLNSAITAAGGYTTNSAYAPKKVYLSRVDGNGRLLTTVINPMNNDITLRPNDVIYVPDKTRPVVGKAFDYMLRVVSPVSEYANAYNNWALMFDPSRYQLIGR